MKRLTISILIIIMCMISFASCSKKEEEIVEITFIHGWGSTEPDHVAMRNIYMDFEKENPNVHINMLSMPTNAQMIRKVEDMIATGKIPDVIFTAGNGTDSLYRFMREHEMLLNIMSYANEDDKFYDSISPITIETWEEDGKLYTASDVLILSGGYWYNKDIFEKAGIIKIPETWEEFYEMLEKIDQLSINDDNDIVSILPSTDAYLYMADEIIFEENGFSNTEIKELSNSTIEKIIERWKEVYFHVPNSNKYSYRDEIALFNEGKLGVFVNGVWGASMINSDINVGYALLPPNKNQVISTQTSALGYLIGNSGDEKKKEASIRFLKYMLSEDVQKRIILETQQMPSNPNIDIMDFYDNLEKFCLAVETVQSADVRTDIPEKIWGGANLEKIDKNIIRLLSEEISKEEFIRNLGIEVRKD